MERFHIEKSNRLSEQRKAEIRELERRVLEEESLQNTAFLDNELNFDREAPCFYLGYEGDRLVSFLTVFFPDQEDGEITAFTHPAYRRRGYFSALLREAAGDLKKLGVGRAVLCLEAESESGGAVLKRLPEPFFLRSEYRMLQESTEVPPLREGLRVLPLSRQNRDEYYAISVPADLPGGEEGADASEEEGADFVEAVLASRTRRGYLLYDGETPVGVFDLETEPDRLFLYGVAVAREYRRKGYGREIVRCALREGANLGKPVVLDVDRDNVPALHLYRSCGFETLFRMDYYACGI